MGLISDWLSLTQFKKLPHAERTIVFYSEGPAYWVHFQTLLEHLTKTLGQTVCYVSSSPEDPGLHLKDPQVHPLQIGDGLVRTVFFQTLDHGVLVMTLTDLGNFYIKRSKMPVHYAYVFHSLVSTHMIYHNHAFDHYDSILCCGPHHINEIRETEAVYGLPPKQLYEHGYGRLDSLLEDGGCRRESQDGGRKRVLIAPSWGPNGLYESGRGEILVDALLAAGFQVTVRVHPQTINLNKACWVRLVERFHGEPNFEREDDMRTQGSLREADIMVSDWSGAALEYAFAFERPILFVDVPRKINNPEYERLNNIPLEVSVRERLGAVISPENIDQAPELVKQLCDLSDDHIQEIRQLRQKIVFNPGMSGRRGAEIIFQLSKNLPTLTFK